MLEHENDFDHVESTDETANADAIHSWQVYFLSIADPTNPGRDFNLVKVGITRNDVERRIEQLQTGNPYPIRCEASFRSPVARQVERWVHRTNASRVAQLEWLRLNRSEIPDLVEAAKQESERLARIAEAMAQWSHLESRGIERRPSSEERRLHEAVTGVLTDLWPLKLQLRRTEASIALQAGNVQRIPGIVKIWMFSPSRRFNPKIALEKFPDLAAGHVMQKVGGSFRWRGVPHLGSPS